MRRNGFYQRSSTRVNWQEIFLYHFFVLEAAAKMILGLAFDLDFCLKKVSNVACQLSRDKVVENCVVGVVNATKFFVVYNAMHLQIRYITLWVPKLGKRGQCVKNPVNADKMQMILAKRACGANSRGIVPYGPCPTQSVVCGQEMGRSG